MLSAHPASPKIRPDRGTQPGVLEAGAQRGDPVGVESDVAQRRTAWFERRLAAQHPIPRPGDGGTAEIQRPAGGDDHLDGIGIRERLGIGDGLAQGGDPALGMGGEVGGHLLGGALGDDIAAVLAGARADVDHVVGGADRVLVVLDHDHRVAEVAQTGQRAQQALASAGVTASPLTRTLGLPLDRAGRVAVVATGKVGLLFLIPGFDETLRVNGNAVLSTRDDDIRVCTTERRAPKLVIRVTVTAAYLHCAKAFLRSKLWSESSKVERTKLPTIGTMIGDQTGLRIDPETREDMERRYAPDL